jgi:hypothetical protein
MNGTFQNSCLMNPKLANSQEKIIVKLAGILKMSVPSSVCVVKRRNLVFLSISCGEKSCHSLRPMNSNDTEHLSTLAQAKVLPVSID